jgi:hypothetical protein
MNAVRPLGIVLYILLVKYLWDDRKCAKVMSHQAVEKDFSYLASLTDFITIRKPEVLSRSD